MSLASLVKGVSHNYAATQKCDFYVLPVATGCFKRFCLTLSVLSTWSMRDKKCRKAQAWKKRTASQKCRADLQRRLHRIYRTTLALLYLLYFPIIHNQSFPPNIPSSPIRTIPDVPSFTVVHTDMSRSYLEPRSLRTRHWEEFAGSLSALWLLFHWRTCRVQSTYSFPGENSYFKNNNNKTFKKKQKTLAWKGPQSHTQKK